MQGPAGNLTFLPHFAALFVVPGTIVLAASVPVFKQFMLLSCTDNCHFRQVLFKTASI